MQLMSQLIISIDRKMSLYRLILSGSLLSLACPSLAADDPASLASSPLSATPLFIAYVKTATAIKMAANEKQSNGCSEDKATGVIRCRYQGLEENPNGKYVPKPKPEKISAKSGIRKSRSGICHDPSSVYFERMDTYTQYPDLAACLESGGRERNAKKRRSSKGQKID